MMIAPVTALQASAQTAHRHPPALPPMTSTAELLGLSTDQLEASRSSGTTLLQLALRQGVTRERLQQGIVADLEAGQPDGAPEVSDAQLAEMATRVANGRDPMESSAHVALAHAAENKASVFVDIASWLGLDPTTLLGSLADGVSLSDVAARQGTSVSSIVARLGGAPSLLVDTWA